MKKIFLAVALTTLAGCSQPTTTVVATPAQPSVTHVESVKETKEVNGVTSSNGTVSQQHTDAGSSAAVVTSSNTVTSPGGTEHTNQSTVKVTSDGGTEGFAVTDTHIALSASGLTKDVTAKGQDVAVQGNNNHLTMHGAAGELSVTGSDNTVEVENPKKITVSGKNNHIVWTGAGKPVVTQTGDGNSVAPK